ncbi:MAG: PAS domain S-box protein, partial [Candidatus Omnitrophica bacterium]|nr:PAS domain S-box protein [Candidatus Omnitrophota bacterium]
KFKKKEKETIDVEISSSVVDFNKGVMQNIVCDITERKKLEKALRESEEKFRTFMETASDLMYITDKYGNFVYVNQAMCSTLGYSPEELISRHLSDVQNKEEMEQFNQKQKELIIKGEVMYETAWETKDRRRVYGEMKIAAIYDAGVDFAGSRGIFRDISERKKIEKSQRLAQLGKLAADVAHEVNNPVTVISARAELGLMSDNIDAESRENFKIILSQCDVAQNIVKRLLMFSKPSKGAFAEENIENTVEFILNLLNPEFMRKKIKIKKEFTEKLPKVNVDEKQIQEVLMNLLRNAMEAMPSGGNITIRGLQENGKIHLDIIDSGVGISEENLKKIMEPFFTTKEHGTGLGLAMCYGIIKTHGGELLFSSKLGEGTTVTILLPVPK